jgi:hypothetical protein
VDKLVKTYDGDVKVVFINNPLAFHDRAMPSAKAAYAAHLQGKFWEYHDLVFENNKSLQDADLEGHAKTLGLDMEKWKKDKESKEIEGWLKGHQALAAAFGATGTPAFFVNGEKLTGAKPFEEFQPVVEKHIAKANKLIKKNVPPEAIHAVLTGNAEGGKYRKYVIDGAKPPSPQQAKKEEGPKEPIAKAINEMPISDSPRKGTGDEIIITECSEFQ